MSTEKKLLEAKRWLQTAQEDLETAQVLSEAGRYAPACFYAQQSAEKALKAMWYFLDHDPWGHSIQRLVRDFPQPQTLEKPEDWLQRAALLDRFYIPTRYPNGLPDLTPGQAYFLQDAEQALEQAAFFLAAAQVFIQKM